MRACPNGCGVDLDGLVRDGLIGHICTKIERAPAAELGRLGDLVSQGDLLANIRETIRRNIELWMEEHLGVPSQRPGFRFLEVGPETIDELAILLSRHATQAIVFTPVPLPADGVSVCGGYEYKIEHDVLGGVWGVEVKQVDRRSLAELQLSMPAPIAEIAAELERRHEKNLRAAEDANRCSGCGRPEHPSDTDDLNRCADCVRAAGDAPLLPNEKD